VETIIFSKFKILCAIKNCAVAFIARIRYLKTFITGSKNSLPFYTCYFWSTNWAADKVPDKIFAL